MGVFLHITVQWIGIGIFAFLLVYSCLQKPSEMQRHVMMLTLFSILFISGYLVKMGSSNLEEAMVGSTLTYIGQPFLLLAAMMLITSFYGTRISKLHYVILCALNTAVPIIVYTNPRHHLFYDTAVFDSTAPHIPLLTTHGILYNVNLVLALYYFVSIVAYIIRGYRRVKSPIKRSLSVYSILMVICGMVGYGVYFLDLTGGYDSTMIGASLGAVCLAVMFFRCRIFDIVDKAKDYALDISDDGLVVFDDANDIIYENGTAKRLMEADIPKSHIETLSGGISSFDKGEKHYSVKVNPITRRSSYLGKSVEIHDDSESVNHRAKLEEAVRVTTERLELIQRTIFGSMASIVEARSLETGDHIKRVSQYSEMIARSLRNMGKYSELLTDEYISTLVLSAPLHDIGKISIPDAILMKPATLTDEEFEVIKTHPEKGAEIINTTMSGLESEAYISMASDSARYHHERWDGSGYPHGLRGSEIPLSARIVALADCYDAMTSKRCYKDAFPDEEALSIIRRERGTHFDPDVVDAFLLCDKS